MSKPRKSRKPSSRSIAHQPKQFALRPTRAVRFGSTADAGIEASSAAVAVGGVAPDTPARPRPRPRRPSDSTRPGGRRVALVVPDYRAPDRGEYDEAALRADIPSGRVDLVVFPEHFVHERLRDAPSAVDALARDVGAPVLTGVWQTTLTRPPSTPTRSRASATPVRTSTSSTPPP